MKIIRWVAALLCVLLIGSLFPTRAFAADIPWYLDAEGVLHITGEIPESGFNLTDEQRLQVKSVVAESGASISSGYSLFYEFRSMVSADLSELDTSSVGGMNYMFYDCRSLTSLDLSSFDTSSVNDMNSMFALCSSLTSLDLSGFNTDSLMSADDMFLECSALASLRIGPDILYKNADGIIAIRSPWQKKGSTDTYSTADELKAVTDTVTLLAMYTVKVQNDGNGTASANSAAALKGDTVTLTATPNTGYHFKEWQSSDVTVSNNTFTMSEKNVTVKAVFEAHSFTNYVSDGNATCTKDGTKTAKCDYCDETDTVPDIGSATGHSFTNYVYDGNATCTKDGTKTAKCEYCDETDTVLDIGSATGHSFTNYVSDGNATCTEDGTKTAKCDYCDATDTIADTGSFSGHGETEIRDAKAATCTEDGYTGDTYCKDCGVRLASGETIPAKGHGETEIKDAKAATCTEDGYTGDIYCTVCREKTASGEVIPAAHSWESDFTVDKEASCAEEGSKSVHCTKCDAKKDETAIKKTEHADADFNGKCDGCGTDLSVTYTVIAGADGEWTKGSKEGLLFTSDADFDKFDSVQVDGSTIAATNYTAKEGSTKITLAPAYLETLSIGSHSIKIVSIDGSASTNFTVKEVAQPPVHANYTVSFNMNGHGTQITALTVESGSKATKPADPKASGYTFGGWYADATFSTKFDFNTAITSNTTAYAKWTKNSEAPADPTSPQTGDASDTSDTSDASDTGDTGDTSDMFLWIALLLVSGGALAGTTVYGRKKKYNAK